MQLGSIRVGISALIVSAVAAVAPDLGKIGGAAAQSTAAPATRGDATGANSNANGSGATAGMDQQAQQAPVIVFSGRVMTDDGSPLSESAAIETICNGNERVEAYTDSKGGFSFYYGDRNSGVFQDASIPEASHSADRSMIAGRPMARRWELLSCELQAKVPGYLSESVHLSADEPMLGTILVHRLGTVEGKLVSVVSLAAPKKARKAFQTGQDYLGKHKIEEARKSFEKAVTLYPEYAVAWQELGKIQFASQQNDEARRSFEAAIKADSTFLDPYLGLAAAQAHDKDWPAVLETANRTIKLDPYDYPQAYYMNAVANFNLNNMDAAEKNAREAEKMDAHGRFPGIRRLLGQILLQRHEYAEAAEQMRGYLKYARESSATDEVRAQLAEIERAMAEAQKTSN